MENLNFTPEKAHEKFNNKLLMMLQPKIEKMLCLLKMTSQFLSQPKQLQNNYSMAPLTRKLAASLLFTGLTLGAFAQETTEKIWVTFESVRDVPALVEGNLYSSNPSVQALIEEFTIVNVEQAVPTTTREALSKVYEVACNCDADALSSAIKERSSVLTNPLDAPNYTLLDTPDDYTATYQSDYALDLINAQGAWDYSIGDASTIIGISDANYYITHEELEGKYIYNDPQNYSTNYYHGTAVAITAAGHTDNSTGKSAIGYNCKLSLTSMSYNKLLQMSQEGIRVINISWASGCYANGYVQAIVDEIYENGTILVAAAGNGTTSGGPSNLVFPAACDHVISVSSIGASDNHERIIGNPNTTHQHNATVDICAPGYDVALTIFPEYYSYGTGTSFAAPIVSGTIGLMLSLKPCMTFEEVEEILRFSADDLDSLNPLYAGMLGAGRLNAQAALELTSINECDGNSTTTPIVVDSLNNGNVITSNPSISNPNNNGFNLNGVVVVNVTTNGTTGNPSVNYNESTDTDKAVDTTLIAGIENTASMEVKLYPNPTAGSATIQLEVSESMELIIVDVRGVVVDRQDLRVGTLKTQINVEHTGIYFLKITKDGEQVWFGKLIKT